jgi:hypothetical protein
MAVKQPTRGGVTDNSLGFHLGWAPQIRMIIARRSAGARSPDGGRAASAGQRGGSRQQDASLLSEIGAHLNHGTGCRRLA